MTSHPKPGARAERDALRTEMLTTGCTTAEICTEMRTRWTMRPREAWRHAHGWSLQDAANRINDLAAGRREVVAADASLLGKWEKWPSTAGRRPSLAVLALLADLYGCDVEALLDLEDRRALPESDLRILRRTSTAVTTDRPAAPHVAEPPPAVTGTETVLAAAAESATWAQWAETTNVGDIALEQLGADVRTLATEYLTGDAVELFRRARVLRDQVFRLLEGHQPPRQSADLYVSAGYLCGLLAWMSSDLGHMPAADTQGRTAWLCAEMAGHDGLRAWVASTRSKVAFWDGRLRDAITHARRGATYQPAGTVGALLACQEADAWSKLGAADETQNALRRAVAARESMSGGDDIGGIFSCPQARQENYAAGAHIRVGLYGDALEETTSALAHLAQQPVRAYGTEAQIHISRAMAHVGGGEAEGAMEALLPVLQLRPEQRLETVVGRMRDLGAMMASGPGSRGAASVAARTLLADWCMDSAPRHLALSSGDAGP
ncbi:XRE family transcriptional regulator [Streptomyces sp. H10-C2]|uniref:XRE family transcriptional regulator n=1 Tax=unclassified Streptomyces TaxID=2593676 RepID=UPI0024B8C72A|nr:MULTISPECIES: XRE family transcriptional regulator [unclassified Streptomyces]MDJ0345222.1 XRE family transcriptional regulator [Streptomyces sp. PH10-H1]MDJ0368832.1 XRE family transcriptional regulator [Streptomyces sp. H10-C2]